MDAVARRFARRIILAHALLLVAVLLVVALAVRHIYHTARDEVVRQAEERQQQLVNQTATGIQSYYKSILDDLTLINRAEQEQAIAAAKAAMAPSAPAAAPTTRPDDTMINRARETFRMIEDYSRIVTDHRNQPLIRRVIWNQLKARVSLLFGYQHAMFNRDPRPGEQRQAPRAGPGPGMHAELVGVSDDTLNVREIVERSRAWLGQIDGPTVSKFQVYHGVGVNLIGVSMLGDKLVAVVPIAGVEKQYLGHLNDANIPTGAWLLDDEATAMAGSHSEFVGEKVDAISDPGLRQMADEFVVHHGTGTQVVPRPFKFGSFQFGPTMIAAAPVTVANTTWELFIATPMSNVDGFVARLLDGAVIWSAIVVIAVTGILASTAFQMIRSRLRAERLRHLALNRELSQARDIQLAWLPVQHPANPMINVAAVNSPASHISGDFYNWFELPDHRLVVVIGDVTGHGMSAAFLMATTQLLVRNTMSRLGDPGQCLEEVNRQLCVQVFNGQFVTMLITIVDVAAGQLHVATAGHPAPMVADGESFQPLPIEPQLVLGVDREAQYPTETFAIAPQASLLLYTDGVVECPDRINQRFGNEQLRRAVYGRYEHARQMLDQVITAVNTFRGSRELVDDLTIVAIQLQAEAAPRDLTAVEV